MKNNPFIEGFIQGVKETPKGYFAPIVALWRTLVETTEDLTSKK